VEKVKLEKLCKEIKPGFPSGNHNSVGEGYLHFRPYNIDIFGRIDLSQNKFVPLKNESYFLKEGDIVFNNTNSPELLGKTCYIKNPDNWVYSNHMTRIRVKDGINPKYCAIFLHYLFYSGFYRANCSNHVNQASIASGFLSKSVEVPLPSRHQQQQIVSKVEELFSELDKSIEELKKAQQQLKVYRQAVLKSAFEKSEASLVYRLAEICDFVTKGTTPTKGHLFSNQGDIPFLKVYNLTFDGSLDFKKEPTFVTKETSDGFLKRSLVYPGDVLMNIVGPPLGKVSIVPDTYPEWNINQAIVRFRCKEVLVNKYLLHFLLSENTIRGYSRKAKATAGQFNLTLEICRDIEIPVPSIEEQQRIIQQIESRLSVCDKIEETITNSLKQAEALRQSILKKAFEGKLIF
jgi:type I restriction enzyme, S subunit